MRGRKAKPAALKEAQGNPGKRKVAAKPKVTPPPKTAAKIAAPAGVKGDARKVWDKLAPELTRMQFLRLTDQAPFARYCDHLARWWKLTKEVEKIGETYETDTRHGKMLRLHPAFTARDRLEGRLEQLEDRFGLTPRARYQVIQMMAGTATPMLPLDGQHADKPKDADGPAKAASPVGILTGTGGSDSLH